MKICVGDWSCGNLLNGTQYKNENSSVNGTSFDGNVDDAFRVARELFDRGLNVMIKKVDSKNVGTKKKPVMSEGYMAVYVDDKNFQQR